MGLACSRCVLTLVSLPCADTCYARESTTFTFKMAEQEVENKKKRDKGKGKGATFFFCLGILCVFYAQRCESTRVFGGFVTMLTFCRVSALGEPRARDDERWKGSQP